MHIHTFMYIFSAFKNYHDAADGGCCQEFIEHNRATSFVRCQHMDSSIER